MADIYGDRYKNLGSLGAGGQADVFRVRDLQDANQTEYALKRLSRIDREGRFRTEVDILQRIRHPNVVPILDQSGDPEPGDKKPSYWFVMPIAAGKSLVDRVELYKGNLDGVLKVGMQLANALMAANAEKVIHRDVKPGNILFPREADHDIWLADFGICHLEENVERDTKTGVIMGPRQFTPPEGEAGGPFTYAYDVYQLGKVLFYMLSGGRYIPREDIDTPAFKAVFAKGERFQLLERLLAQMIAPLDRRISTPAIVLERLKHIDEWDQRARDTTLNPVVLASIDKAQKAALERQRARERNQVVRKDNEAAISLVTNALRDWLNVQLTKLKGTLEQNGTHSAEIEDAAWDSARYFGVDVGRKTYIASGSIQVGMVDLSDIFKQYIVLKLFICSHRALSISVGNNVPQVKPIDPEMALIPYIAIVKNPQDTERFMGGFLRNVALLEKSHQEMLQRTGRHRMRVENQPAVGKTFIGPSTNLMLEFKASEWPSNIDAVTKLYSDSVQIAIDYLNSDNRSVAG